MAHFYGTIQGMRGEATRTGSKSSGMTAYAAGWGGAVRVDLRHNPDTDKDEATVTLVPWQGSGGGSKVIYSGPVDRQARDA